MASSSSPGCSSAGSSSRAPLDAVLWAAPFAGYALVLYWRRWRLLVGGAVVVALGFLPFLVITLLYNRHVTGSFTQFPLTAKDPLDTFGFGLRRLMPGAETFSYSGRAAVDATLDNLGELPRFLFGGLLGVAAAAVGLWMRRRDRSTLALLFLVLAFPLGYFVFWGNLLSTKYSYLSSPVYYIPLYFPLCVLLATVLLAAWRHLSVAAVVLSALLVLATLPSLVEQIRVNHRISAAQEPWRDASEGVTRPVARVRGRRGRLPAPPQPVLAQRPRPRRATPVRGESRTRRTSTSSRPTPIARRTSRSPPTRAGTTRSSTTTRHRPRCRSCRSASSAGAPPTST